MKPTYREDQLVPGGWQVPHQTVYALGSNPCVRVFGAATSNQVCRDCRHATPATGADNYGQIVCDLRGETHCPRSTWPGGTPACARWERAERRSDMR